jgi:hypothetical protein
VHIDSFKECVEFKNSVNLKLILKLLIAYIHE